MSELLRFLQNECEIEAKNVTMKIKQQNISLSEFETKKMRKYIYMCQKTRMIETLSYIFDFHLPLILNFWLNIVALLGYQSLKNTALILC
jgi:hypothetical protein